MLTRNELAALAKAWEDATKGIWTVEESKYDYDLVTSEEGISTIAKVYEWRDSLNGSGLPIGEGKANATFITAAHAMIPRLIEDLTRLHGWLELHNFEHW